MALFYKISDKELLEARKGIFLKEGIPALEKNGFSKAPFSTSWYGKNNLGDYTYELCRLRGQATFELLVIHISSGDEWIKIYLNIFELSPSLTNLTELQGKVGTYFHLPPSILTQMRLRIDDFKGMPIFRTKEHKLGRYYSQSGLQKRIKELSVLISSDLNNIDSFVVRWYDLHTPIVTDWQGKGISS